MNQNYYILVYSNVLHIYFHLHEFYLKHYATVISWTGKTVDDMHRMLQLLATDMCKQKACKETRSTSLIVKRPFLNLHNWMDMHTGLNVDETHSSSGTPKVPVTSVIFAATSLGVDTDPCQRKWRTIRPFHETLSLDFGDPTGSVTAHHNSPCNNCSIHFLLIITAYIILTYALCIIIYMPASVTSNNLWRIQQGLPVWHYKLAEENRSG